MVSVAKFDQWQSGAGVVRGTVLQTVGNTSISPGTFSTSTTVFSLSITPTSSSSKILAFAFAYAERNGGSSANYVHVNLNRTIGGNTVFLCRPLNAMGYQYSNNARSGGSVSYLDSPATTSTITYTISIDAGAIGASSFTFYDTGITLMEIQG